MSRPLPKPGWSFILLIAALSCIALALLEAERSIRRNNAMANLALSGYAKFAAWSFHQHLTESLRGTVREALSPVNHGEGLHMSPGIPAADELGHLLPWDITCACHRAKMGPMPAFYLGYSLRSDTVAFGFNHATTDLGGWLADAPTPLSRDAPHEQMTPEETRLLVDTLNALAHAGHGQWGYYLLSLPTVDRWPLVAMTTMPTSWGDTLVYAAAYDRGALESILNGVLDNGGLLPEALVSGGRTNRSILSVQVSDVSGKPLLASAVPAKWELSARVRLPADYAGLIIQTQFVPELANTVIIGGLPRSRLPMLLTLLAVAAGLAFIATSQLRRDVRFMRERTDFVANVSHELRTPLTQIRLAVDTLRLGREPDANRRTASLDMVDREVTRLQHLVEGVLRFARTGARAVEVSRADVDVAGEVEAVVAEFAPLAGARHVSIELSVDHRPVATLQPGAIRQILLNLLDNAVKFGPAGQVITVRVSAAPNEMARIEVSDQGPGIDQNEHDRVWRPFERGSASAAVGGSGIGLTVVREIAGLHGGTAVIAASDAAGTTVRVDLPRTA